MIVQLEGFQIDFEMKDNIHIQGVLLFTPKDKPTRKIARFTGERFDIYNIELLIDETNQKGLKNKIGSILQEFETAFPYIDSKSNYMYFKSKDIVGYISILVEMLLEINLLVYTNNNLRYNSSVIGKLLLVRVGYNFIKNRFENYNYLQTKIIPTSKATGYDGVIESRMGNMVTRVSVYRLFEGVVEEEILTTSDLVHFYKYYNR